ncbi:uncharacterized protein RCO7_11087 [Rhynchosporium graminicola]|uniref:Integral membrane protein n=1 Tax=Rhynchosporium graminicola TaxID=2792576 RepID=A0A1E1KVG7_9HELO|nr:uncharacterized protein RCO7_11087 [Rhynchosporium commune]
MISTTDYSQIPAHDPPQDITANFINPDTIACSLLEVSLPLSFISTVLVALRIYTRLKLVKSPGWDDQMKHGNGEDIWNLYNTTALTFHKLRLASLAIYHLALLWSKISILIKLLRFNAAPIPSTIFRITVFSVMAFTALFSLASAAIISSGCSPSIEIPRCVINPTFAYVYGACNILSSWAIFGLGIVVCLRRRVLGKGAGNAQRWCMGFVIAVGILYVPALHCDIRMATDWDSVCVTSIARLVDGIPHIRSENVTRFEVSICKSLVHFLGTNRTVSSVLSTSLFILARWCEIELTSALIFASLLALSPLLTAILRTYFPPQQLPATSYLDTESSTPSHSPSPTCKISKSASSTLTPQPSTSTLTLSSLSHASSRRDVPLSESEKRLSAKVGGIALVERRVLGGSVGRKGLVLMTVEYAVRYEACLLARRHDMEVWEWKPQG